MNAYIEDAFTRLNALTEDTFELTDTGVEKLKEFEEEPIDDEIIITDIDAEEEDDLEDSYLGKVILDCDVCHALFYKDKDDVVIDEDTELANVGEECPYCASESGYKIIGQVAEFCKECDDKKDEVKDEEEISVDEKDFNESLRKTPSKKAVVKKLTEARDRTSKRDRIDARRDDRVERAKKAFNRVRDDSDADRDYRLKKAGLKESDDSYIANARKFADEIGKMTKEQAARWYYKEYGFHKQGPADKAEKIVYDALRKQLGLRESKCNESDKPTATSIEDAQKWVDYDMKRYGRISKKTQDLVDKAGFQIIKSDHGQYEVAAGKFESRNRKPVGSRLKEAPIYGLETQYDARQSFHGKAQVETDNRGNETLYSYGTPVAKINARGKVSLLPRWDESQTTLRHVKEFLKQHGLKADSLAQIKKDYLKEDFERVDIETDREKMSMTADKDGKVTVTTEPRKEDHDAEMVEPLELDTKAEIEDNSIDIDVDDFSEEEFDELGESYLKKVYENVDGYKTTGVKRLRNGIKVEGLIKFASGNSKKTSFAFEAKEATKSGNIRLIGENLEITRGKKAFSLVGRVDGKKLISESLNYNYRTKDSTGKSQRINGTVKVSKK